MNINLYKIMTDAMKHTSVRLIDEIKSNNDNKLPEREIERISTNNILNQEYGTVYIEAFLEGVIIEYHENLYEKLLESGIDIGIIEI